VRHKRQAEERRSARNLFGWSISFQFIDNKEAVSNTTLKHHIVLGAQPGQTMPSIGCRGQVLRQPIETCGGKGESEEKCQRGSHISWHIAQRLSHAAACRAAQPDENLQKAATTLDKSRARAPEPCAFRRSLPALASSERRNARRPRSAGTRGAPGAPERAAEGKALCV
jgi:hypothetical protein